ncbi:MAG: hypothetical protein SGJ09_00015 [Phycisphaerae bacterium]|nr:hypothetical protein [Phycisphaerae bacterium]
MSRDELLDLAPLDAFGLLDEYEAALFHRSFHHAPASVQVEVRTLQSELVQDPAFLSVDEPRGLLRQKVLLRVQEEIEETAEQLQPLAHIGQAGRVVAKATLGAIAVRNSAEHSQLAAHSGDQSLSRPVDSDFTSSAVLSPDRSQDAGMRELVAEIRARTSLSAKDRATPYWRAATFFFGAGLVVSLYFLARTTRTAEMVAQLATNQVVAQQLVQAVPSLADFAFRNSHLRGLTSVDSSVNATATLYVDKEHGRSLLVAFGLSASKGSFTLRAVDDRGNATVIANFKTSDPVFGMVVDNMSVDVVACKLELLDGDGRVILRTA